MTELALRAYRDLSGDRSMSGRVPFAAASAWADRAGLAGPSFWVLWDQLAAMDAALTERRP